MMLVLVMVMISSYSLGGSFGIYSWTDVANCQSFLSIDPLGKGEQCKKWISVFIEHSPSKVARACTVTDRLRGKMSCSKPGDLCVASDGSRLWACQKFQDLEGQKQTGAWTPIGDCTPDSLLGSVQLEHCLAEIPKENSVCGDVDRAQGTHGGICDQGGKICKSPDFLRAWRCDLNQDKQGGWLEVRNCSHEKLKDLAEYKSCKSQITNLTQGKAVALCSGIYSSAQGLPCDKPNKLCFANKNRDILMVCQ